MKDSLNLLQENWIGFILLILGFAISVYIIKQLINSLAKTFCWGKFSKENAAPKDLMEQNGGAGYIVISLMVKIIDDFRHLLALLIVSIFFFALIYAMVYAGDTFEEKMKGVQGIAASLGGLIGSIIGYYFGESAGKRKAELNVNNGSGISNEMQPSNEEIVQPEAIETKKTPDLTNESQ